MDDSSIMFYAIAIIVGIAVSYFVFRWIFSIDKIVKQNASIINLLSLIARKNGATSEEVKNSITF